MAPRNKLLAAAVVIAGSVAGALYVRQQIKSDRRERVGLYYPDGTLVELGPEDAVAAELLERGRELLARVRSEES
jgi:hypothetical protein